MTADAVPEIQGYTDLQEIGRGGFAVVYKARQMSVGRDVAIKLLTDPAPDDDLIRRFERESKAVGALSWHPHIAAVVDAGSTASGQAYIVFELLPGGSLEDRLARSPLPWAEAVASMIQVADAVEAAHRADVLHRDIKPANILLDRLGVAKLGDFGIASMQDGNKTEAGMLATTIAHAAPELFDGVPSSAATDVYALGSTLHTLVTGKPPFAPAPGEVIAVTIAQIISKPPPRPDISVAPVEVSNVVAHALAKQPQYRPRTAAAFGHALQQAQRDLGQRVTAMPVSDSEPDTQQHQLVRPTDTAHRETNDMRSAPPAPTSDPLPHEITPSPAATSDRLPHEITPSPTATSHAASPSVVEAPKKAFSRLIPALSIVAALMAAGLGALILFNIQRDPAPIAITVGGARILEARALPATEMAPPFDGRMALDNDATTAWGIAPSDDGIDIQGSSYSITLTEEQTIVRVGIINPNETELGRVAGVSWGTGFDNGVQLGDLVTQDLPNGPGTFMVPFSVRTNQINLVLLGAHDGAENAGIAEILIEVAEETDQ